MDINLLYNFLIEYFINILNKIFYISNKIYNDLILNNYYFNNYLIKKHLLILRNNKIYNNNLYINNILELFNETYKIKLNIFEKNFNKNYIIMDLKKNNEYIVDKNLMQKQINSFTILKNSNIYSQEFDLIKILINKNKNINLLKNLYYNYYFI